MMKRFNEFNEINEAAHVPSNIEEFAKRRGVLPLVKKVAKWVEKAGEQLRGGTAVGKDYGTLVLDIKHHGAEIRINLDTDAVTLHDAVVKDAKSFKKVFDLNEAVAIDEGTDLGEWNQGGLKADKNVVITQFAGPKDIEELGLGRKCMQINVGSSNVQLNPADILELQAILKSYKVK